MCAQPNNVCTSFNRLVIIMYVCTNVRHCCARYIEMMFYIMVLLIDKAVAALYEFVKNTPKIGLCA
jgi:hypothetical protein